MSSIKAIFIAAITIVFPTLAVAQDAPSRAGEPKSTTRSSEWPPVWIEGAWKVEHVQQTCNGEASDKKFVFADYVLFTSGHRFSLYQPRRLTSAPMIGHRKHGESLHCLFKMTRNRAAMQTVFTQHDDHLEYCSYLIMPTEGRYRFKRRLTRITNEAEFVDLLQTAANDGIQTPASEAATEIVEAWIKKHTPPVNNQ
ncbi:MAG: hypothetical protein WBD20_22725 [Pirellulaceae bacterium]